MRRLSSSGLCLGILTGLLLSCGGGRESAPPSAPQATETTSAGFQSASLTSDGRVRTYWLYVPPSYDGKAPLPLVIVLHGGGGNATQVAANTRFNAEAAKSGFIVAYPDGTSAAGGESFNWNDGRPGGAYPGGDGVDDVAFVRRLLDKLEGELKIDPRRVYATGISNGGMMAYRLGCELADRLAAIGPVSATLTFAECAPSQPVSLVHIHGTADRFVPYPGGVGIERVREYRNAPVREVVDRWRVLDGCGVERRVSVQTVQGEKVLVESAGGCRGGTDVVLYTIEGGEHAWPGARTAAALQTPSKALNATSVIWDFFRTHPKSP
jgi:polyhydroxybutyrate depolymerase